MLKELNKRVFMKKSQNKTDIDFILKKRLIYHSKKKMKRLCIPLFCEKQIFELTHDLNNHAGYHKVYHRLMKFVYIPKMSRKIRQYIKYCFFCELNQIKKHAIYEELMFIAAFTILFKTLIMNFIVALSEEMDSVLTVTCKIFKRVAIIAGKFT